jgi:hypothetical protein
VVLDDAPAHRPRRRPLLRGYVANGRWPAWFDPTTFELEPEPLGPFPQSLRLTEAGDVQRDATPGGICGNFMHPRPREAMPSAARASIG